MDVDEEDKAVLLVSSLPRSYRNFKGIILYGSGETLSLNDVKTSLLAKEKYDSENISEEQVECLIARGRTPEKGNGSQSKFRSKSKGRNNKKLCCYCRKKGHEISECFKLKNKEQKSNSNI